MNPQKAPHIWSVEALYSKAELYAEEMHSKNRTDWQFGFWSALCLEMLLRASVANISPSLLASPKDWTHALFAAGRKPNVKKYVPRSVDVGALIPLVASTFPEFTAEMANFCVDHFEKRNSEIHTGDMAFQNLGTSSWLPSYYLTCECLISLVGSNLADFFGSAIAQTAEHHIQAAKDNAAQSVRQSISAHRTIWEEKDQQEREVLIDEARSAMTRYYGHRVPCPACGSVAALHGSPSGPVSRSVEEDEIIERQPMLPSNFECMACGLRIAGYSKLVACGLGDLFTETSHYEPLEFFDIDVEDHYRSMMEDDRNE
jgi:hypothetical protein